MKVFLEREGEVLSDVFASSVAELLKQLGLNAEEVLVVRNGVLVTEDEELSEDDEVKILSVVSGG